MECLAELEVELLSLPQPNTSFSTASQDDIDLDLQCDTDDVHHSAQTGYNSLQDTSQIQTKSPPFVELCLPLNNILKPSQDKACSPKLTSDTGEHDSHELQNTRVLINATGIRCIVCDIQFSTDQALELHMIDKHTIKEEVSNFVCSICGRDFCNAQSLKRHGKTHNKSYLVNYWENQPGTLLNMCSFCPHVSKSKRLLKDHIVKKHSKDRKIFKCNRCPFSCLKLQTLSLHNRRHDEEPKFACDQCGKLYLTMSILKRHAKTHIKTTLYTCEVPDCKKSFNMKGRLTDHVRTVHNSNNKLSGNLSESKLIVVHDVILPDDEIKNFQEFTFLSQPIKPDWLQSDVSHKVTTQKSLVDYKKRQKIKSDSNKRKDTALLNKCVEKDCKAVFTDGKITNKKKRMKFACSWIGCGRKFRDSHNLRMHTFTHTGEMQRACTLCRYRCVQKSALDSHMAKHMKEIKLKTQVRPK